MTNALDLLPPVPEPEAVSFAYSLRAHGGASLRLALGQRTFAVENFGNTTDGLGDLVRAALQVATGNIYADVIFDEEPQRWGLAIEPAGLSRDHVRISRVTMRDGGTSLKADGHSNRPVWTWATLPVVIEGHVTTDAFARAVLATAQQARKHYDDATYRNLWGYCGSLEGFPLRGLRALETALAITEYRE